MATESEPDADSAICTAGLIDAMRLTRHVPDVARYRTYHQAVLDGLAFVRGLQFTDENADHYEKGFRTRFLTGGAHLSPSDGTIRVDATAGLVSCQLRFLRSGAETAAK
jgi:hypothetical protein